MIVFLAIEGFVRNYNVNRFREKCKRLDLCHFFIDDSKCLGLIVAIDRLANKVSIEVICSDHESPSGEDITGKILSRSIHEIYP